MKFSAKWKKGLLVVMLYAAGFFSAMFLLAPADAEKYGKGHSRAEILAVKVHVQLRRIVEFADKKASKVGNATTARLMKHR